MHKNASDWRDSVARTQCSRAVGAPLVRFVLLSGRKSSVFKAIDATHVTGSHSTVPTCVGKRAVGRPRTRGIGRKCAQFRPVVIRRVLQERQKANDCDFSKHSRTVRSARFEDVDSRLPAHPAGTTRDFGTHLINN